MNQRVVVRQGVTGWSNLIYLLGPALMVVGGIFLANQEAEAGWSFIIGGLVVTAIVVVGCLIYNRRVRYVTDTGSGFIVEDSAGKREIADTDVTALAYHSTREFTNGLPTGLKRFFNVWTHHDSRPIEMENLVKNDHFDPLNALIERLFTLHEENAIDAMARGETISGDGWQLSTNSLQLEKPSETVASQDITAIERHEGKLCIWRVGEEEPFARLPLDSKNVHLLSLILSPWIEERERTHGAKTDLPGLGRVLFKKEGSMNSVFTLIALGIVLIAVGPIVFLTAGDEWWIGLALAAGGAACFLGAYGTYRSSFRCHERGVYQRTMFSETKLPYDEVAIFTNATTRMYTNGAYTGTSMNLTFDPGPAAPNAKTIRYNTMVRGGDEDLNQLRDRISLVLKVRMFEDVMNHGNVQWGEKTVIRADGVEHTPAGFFGNKLDTVFIPWKQFNFDIQQGVCHLFKMGEGKSIGSETTASPNFYPGLFLVLGFMPQNR